MQFTFFQFIKEQWTALPPVVKIDLSGKTVIVTGANIGLGFESAKHFARMNPGKLILACRSEEKGRAAVAKIKGRRMRTVELWVLDLASFASVKSFAERFEKEGGRLDILVENAGVFSEDPLQFTNDGWETSVQVNNLSTSLLALLLLPRLLKTAEKYNTTPRLVVVSSGAHSFVKFEKCLFDAPSPFQLFAHRDHLASGQEDVFGGTWRYPKTKLLNILFTRALNDRLHRKPLIVNTVNPGLCYSALHRSFTGLQALIDWLMGKALARSTEEGSRNFVWAAIGGEEKKDELRGAYISTVEVSKPSEYVTSKEGNEAQEKFWDNLIEELTNVEPKVPEIVKEYLTAPVER